MKDTQRDLLIELACVFRDLASECEKDETFLQFINGLADKKVFTSDLIEAAAEIHITLEANSELELEESK